MKESTDKYATVPKVSSINGLMDGWMDNLTEHYKLNKTIADDSGGHFKNIVGPTIEYNRIECIIIMQDALYQSASEIIRITENHKKQNNPV